MLYDKVNIIREFLDFIVTFHWPNLRRKVLITHYQRLEMLMLQQHLLVQNNHETSGDDHIFCS